LRYIAEAPLRRLTETYCAHASAASENVPVGPPLLPIMAAPDALPYQVDEAIQLAAIMIEEAEEPPAAPNAGQFVHNKETNFIHIVARRKPWERQIPGRANCGWNYRAQGTSPCDTFAPASVHCGKCARPATWQKLLQTFPSEESASENEASPT
jgi:hypothetical protein